LSQDVRRLWDELWETEVKIFFDTIFCGYRSILFRRCFVSLL